jgi:hypothetical protein
MLLIITKWVSMERERDIEGVKTRGYSLEG